jgi:RNA polymerase sigma-70 factor (ECF subfamily)
MDAAGLRPELLAQAEEAAVVALASAGEQSAFAELVRRRQAGLRSLLAKLCRDRAMADDLAQEALLKAWQQLPTLKAHGAFGGWLRQITINVWLQHRRVRGNKLLHSEDLRTEEASHVETVGEGIDLDGALAQMPELVRLCLTLHHREGMSHSEIAEATSLPIGTIKTNILRGSARLREILSAYQESRASKGDV